MDRGGLSLVISAISPISTSSLVTHSTISIPYWFDIFCYTYLGYRHSDHYFTSFSPPFERHLSIWSWIFSSSVHHWFLTRGCEFLLPQTPIDWDLACIYVLPPRFLLCSIHLSLFSLLFMVSKPSLVLIPWDEGSRASCRAAVAQNAILGVIQPS